MDGRVEFLEPFDLAPNNEQTVRSMCGEGLATIRGAFARCRCSASINTIG